MLAIGAGGLAISLALAGEPLRIAMPEIWGVRLTGTLPDWVSAKDVILEMLRRHGTSGATGRIIEYHGPGVTTLSAMDRHVIANMGTELCATTTPVTGLLTIAVAVLRRRVLRLNQRL